MECPCFYYEDDEEHPGTCTCGHDFDEHDQHFDCRAAEVEHAPREDPGTGPSSG